MADFGADNSVKRVPSSAPFTAADLPMREDGEMYHLQLARQNLANDILIVGDPGRATKIAAQFLSETECNVEHRGLRTITGIVPHSRQRVSVVTSGMGTPSLEIVLNELMAINEIDPVTRTRRPDVEPLNIIRVGTSGLLREDTALGTSIISNYAVG
jgi:uridine phosphorylase